MIRTRLLVALAACLFVSSCSQMHYVLKQEAYLALRKPIIKVRVVQTSGSVTVAAKGSFIVRTHDNNNEKSAYFSATPVMVKASKGFLKLTDQKGNVLEQKLRKVTVVAELKSWLFLNDKKFRGIFEFYPQANDTFYTVNVLHIEDYLRGVLQAEIGNRTSDEFEAVKAQAVAARTYALVTRGKYPDKGYELIDDIADQVYIGAGGEQEITNKAVKQTTGEVLEYGGGLIDAYYHSTCAGHTENIEDVWEKDPRPYLKGVDDSDYCAWSKFYVWADTFTTGELLDHIRSYLRGQGGGSGRIGKTFKDAKVLGRTPGDRVKEVSIVTDAGEATLKKDQIRWALGRHAKPGILPSTNFQLAAPAGNLKSSDQIVISGKGYGHGIGMCQCGAIGRARAGIEYKQILTHYYTGVQIEKLY